jgi:hypothetical protein
MRGRGSQSSRQPYGVSLRAALGDCNDFRIHDAVRRYGHPQPGQCRRGVRGDAAPVGIDRVYGDAGSGCNRQLSKRKCAGSRR